MSDLTPDQLKQLFAADKEIERKLKAGEIEVIRDPMPIGRAVDKVIERKARIFTPEEIRLAQANSAKKAKESLDRERRERISGRLDTLAIDTGPRLSPRECTLKTYQLYDPREAKTPADRKAIHAQHAVHAECVEYCRKIGEHVTAGHCVMLIGRPGTGKDHLCVAIAREAMIHCDRTAKWIDGKHFYSKSLDASRGTISKAWTNPLVAAGILILSDPVQPNEEKPREHEYKSLWRVINDRYLLKRPTFITSNCENFAQFAGLIGDQIMSRLKQGALQAECTWSDYRER